MRRCVDDHDNEFFFHGIYQRDDRPVVIVENVKSHRMTELYPTDVTFKNDPPPPLYSLESCMPPQMDVNLNEGYDSSSDLFRMMGGSIGVNALITPDVTDQETTVEGEINDAIDEAMPGEEGIDE